MGTVVFLLVFVGGWIGLGRYWWRTSRHRVLSVLGAGALCFVVGAFAGSAIDGAMTTSPRPVAAAVPRAKAPAPAPMAPTAPAPVATASTPPPAAPAPPDEPNVFERRAVLEKKALAGDYQAQRNLAYSLGREIPINELQSCTWRIVVLESGSDEVDDSDVTNKQAACDRKLSPDATYAAGLKAATLQDKIAARRK